MKPIRALAALLMAAAPFAAQAQSTPAPRPDQLAFKALYKELVDTNTELSDGDCTLAASRMAARLKAAGYPDADLHPFQAEGHPKEGGLVAVLHGSDPKAKAILLLALFLVKTIFRRIFTNHKSGIAAFRANGVKMAVATDLNPGTSPLNSLLLAMNMAATQFRLTVEECLLGTTRNAAAALGRPDVGTLEAGQKCHLAIWDIEHPAELVYRIGFNPLHRRIWSRS